ncbi:hypothetical protein [Alicyclobacillus macrosporangiidus]|uniref:hypothetical protein n=1 Tax=Alicyclobacillus macrosporangiidus TaxID=392015 RepID=UPI0012DE6DBC|nr:hypothetical protein [Alicyclobacillus macrosporangiidus]
MLAIYAGIIPWVLDYPDRHIQAIYGDADYTFSGPTLLSIYAFIGLYALWFALPHTGTEILFLIFFAPVALFWLIVIAVNWFGHLLLLMDSERHEWVKRGLSYAEWEIYKNAVRLRDDRLASQAYHEREASFAGQDIRKTRFRVMTGGKKEAGK